MQKIRLHPSGREVDCAAGDTVLGALEAAGYALPSHCRAGACGECKVRVRSGQFDQGMVLDMALSPDERRQGYGLMCMAKPLSAELVIEWGTEDARPKLYPPRENRRFVLVDRIPRTPDIVELRLRPVGEVMRYWPGQYVTLGDERSGAPPRCYSIANAPRADGEIALLVTRVADGRTSCWAHDVLRDGDVVDVSGPYGTFVGDPLVASPVLCMASGSGLAPILALNEAALLRGYRNPVTMMFSARTSADLFDEGLMRYWETRHRNFSWKPTLTRETREGFLSGRIPAVLPQVFSDLSKHRIFIAGNPDFVVACAAAAKALGAREDMTYTEGYFAQAQPQTAPASHLVSG